MFKLVSITFLTLVTFLIGYLSINIYRKFILTYRIFGKPKKRDFHKTPIPNSSGIVFLFIFIIAGCGIKSYMDVFDLFNIIVGGTIVCINGFWDDLKMINPYQKILYQLIAVIFIIYNNDLVVQNLHGFLGIEHIPYWLGFGFTTFIGVFMINAFNLIDGIDGLAATTAVISFVAYAIIFWILNYKGYFGICVILIGIILSYLPYNFSEKRKVFMGDSGALFIGYLLFVMAMLVVNNSEPVIDRLIDRTILPIAPMVIFIFPMVDTFSVYTLRLYAGGSPFAPDHYHTHHLVLAFTNSHFMTSLIINFVCLFLICLFSFLAFRVSALTYISLFFIVFFGLVLFIYFFRSIYRKKIFSVK